MKYQLIVACLIGVLGFTAGCGAGEDESRTARQRRTADPQAVSYLVRAQGAYRDRAYNAALVLADSAVHRAPELADAYFLRGRIFSDLKRYELAEAAYRKALALDPSYPGIRLNLGINAFGRGQFREALDLFREEQAVHPSTNLLLEMGRAYAELGVADSARAAYEQALAADSTNKTAYMWLGQLYEEDGELETALSYSRRGLALDPDNPNYRYIVGSQLFRSGHVEEALPYLRAAAEAMPWHHGAHYSLGQALLRLDHRQEGERYLHAVDSLQRMEARIAEARALTETHPREALRWAELADALRAAGRLDEAHDAYSAALALTPRDLALQNNVANLSLMRGDTTGAILRYRSILRLDSTLADVWLNLGVVYANGGRLAEARQAWERALQSAPGHPTARAYLARLATMR